MHFFSPANVMKLLEVVRGNYTSPQTIATVMALGRTLGKVSILAGNCDGFIANRMHMPLGNEVDRLIEQGASPEQIDRVMSEFGLAMGPVAVRDLVGIDTAYRLRDQRRKLHPGKQPPTPLIDRLFAMGRLGQKVGKGYYSYVDRKPQSDAEVDALIEDIAREQGFVRRPIADDEIGQRLIYALINEAARILDEGIALRVGDVDLAYVHGYGFPAWRGGPMFWAESIGLGDVVQKLRAFAARFGSEWTPSPYLERAAEAGGWPKS
jgi:3-hydroxyacyl-CoA dehydrogenase